MSKEPKRLVLYFGTTAEGSGHNITVLSGNISTEARYKLEIVLDSEESIYSQTGVLLYFLHYRGMTVLCTPFSAHDNRFGSKTMFLVEGNISFTELITELLKYQWVVDILYQIEKQYNLTGVKFL